MSRKQYIPHGSSHEKKLSRKERREQSKNNPMMQTNQEPMMVSAPTESDKRQLRNLTIIGVVSLIIILGLMYYMTANNG